ncbi:Spo0E family sporulation regulatory protein-aspartic acid phosphatase [Clostridium niameyense]|uniref:Spo0E family sporulation regulatory protein-aspartic acid phosphatase n=1 Tax=Clostridium niameyense TaxID=1622073 RepID=A0A6M0RB24_9CLOT|nr:Spo0E family sporulation regulatory protein-aspartic acid phosphatase [Clostridium niameyense]NEZ46870.1 Spo0E family sporulation regulatory protein-aspartic acid phosphatase [Clostridium niameyense]
MIAISLKKAQEKLNKLLENDATLYEGEVLKLSQELDKLIYVYYNEQKLIN